MKKNLKYGVLAIAMILVLSVSVYAMGNNMRRGPPAAPSPTIVDVAINANADSGEFGILIAALQAADPAIINMLSSRGQYTVFAPTDAAFLALLEELNATADDVLGNQELLNTVLTYHVVPGKRMSEDVIESSRLRTFNGDFLFQDGGILTDVNGRDASIVAVDIGASNGVIHVIDRVVLPTLG
jgi:uncharacterized surface protein with fasciclin (FAS1) repeats